MKNFWFIYFFSDELENRFKDINSTAIFLRKNVIDTLMEYTCNHDNQSGCNKSKQTEDKGKND